MGAVPIAIITPDQDIELEAAASERTQEIALEEEDRESTREPEKLDDGFTVHLEAAP
jgi:hypothetical protein